MTADTLERLKELCERSFVLTIVRAEHGDWRVTVGALGSLVYKGRTLKAAVGAAYVDILGAGGASNG